MDNASKAIIMAGAVLVAVMIISLGVLLFNSASKNTEEIGKQVETREVLQYNQRFSVYAGSNVSGSDVRSLLNSIEMHNSNANELDIHGKITITDDSSVNKSSEVVLTKKYTVEIASYDSQGAISSISIK